MSYYISRVLPVTFNEVVERTRNALKAQSLLLVLVASVLGIVALIKYLRS
jgi:hypothetical protein